MALYTELDIHVPASELLSMVTDFVINMPRSAKPVVGMRLFNLCVRIVTLISEANEARDKVPFLNELLKKKTEVEVLLRLCLSKKFKFISPDQYGRAIKYTISIGKQANAWKRPKPRVP